MLEEVNKAQSALDIAKREGKTAISSDNKKEALAKLEEAKKDYEEAIKGRAISKEKVLEAQEAKLKALVKEGNPKSDEEPTNLSDANLKAKDAAKLNDQAKKMEKDAKKAVASANTPLLKERAQTGLLESKQARVEAKVLMKRA